jgi:anti-sigma B factor antagonist
MDEAFHLRELAQGYQIVEITGALDASGAEDVKDYLLRLVDRGHHRLAVNLDSVGIVDSTGLEALSSAYMKLLAVGGRLFVICSNPRILRLFELVGWQDMMEFFESEDAVLRFLETIDDADWFESY